MASAPLPAAIDSRFPLSRLDDDFIEYYNKYLAIKPATHNLKLAELRTNPAKYASPWCRDYTYESFVNDIQLKADDGHQFTARLYLPDPRTSPFGDGPYPVHINFHGGGFVLGDLTGDADICMLVRNRVGIIVLDVDYRLAPEHSFGEGHDDAWAVTRWVHEHGSEIGGKPDSISIGGISAGGHISAVCQQLARDADIDLKLAVISVPPTTKGYDVSNAADSPFPSVAQNEFAPCFNLKRMQFFRTIYGAKSDEAKRELGARPAFFLTPLEGNLQGVCNTYIATADCDPLRDEGEEYGRRLVQAGVKVTVRRYTGVPHPFMHMLQIKKAQLYISDICAELKTAHAA